MVAQSTQANLTTGRDHILAQRPARPAAPQRPLRAAIIAAVLIGPLLVLAPLGDHLNPLLQYERERILAGEWWRLITGHLVHLDAAHLAANAAVILAWLYLFNPQESLSAIICRFFGYALLIGLGMLLLSPSTTWMLGVSAISYALIGGSAFRAVLDGPRQLGVLLLAVLSLKTLAEQVWGVESLLGHFVTYPIASEAHMHGIAAGILVEVWRRAAHTSGEGRLNDD